jgi:hypothetical protein
MKQFIFVIGAIAFSAYIWKSLDLRFVEYKVPEPYFIVKTFETNTCISNTGETIVTRTIEQVKVEK